MPARAWACHCQELQAVRRPRQLRLSTTWQLVVPATRVSSVIQVVYTGVYIMVVGKCSVEAVCIVIRRRFAVHALSAADDNSRCATISQHSQDVEQHQTLSAGVDAHQCLVHWSRICAPRQSALLSVCLSVSHSTSFCLAFVTSSHVVYRMVSFRWPWVTVTRISRSLYTYKSNVSKTVRLRDKVTIEH